MAFIMCECEDPLVAACSFWTFISILQDKSSSPYSFPALDHRVNQLTLNF